MAETCSPIRELNLLKEFEDNCAEPYAQWGWLDDFGELAFLREEPELRAGLLGFATANGSGSLYALWRRDERADLAGLPVVLLGDEGGLHVVARDLREFLRLLGALEAQLACDWDCVYERDEEELPARGEYLAWLEATFGLTPPEEPWDIVLDAQDELDEEWTRWIRPLLPDAVFSEVSELNLLKRFEDGAAEPFAGGFTLCPPEDEEGGEDGTAELLVFATANDEGDAFALWRRDDRAELATLPVVVVGETDFHVVARDFMEFLQLLGALDRLEVHVDPRAGLRTERDESGGGGFGDGAGGGSAPDGKSENGGDVNGGVGETEAAAEVEVAAEVADGRGGGDASGSVPVGSTSAGSASVGGVGVILRACEPSPAHAQYLAWLNERFALAPAQDAAAAIRAAQTGARRERGPRGIGW